MFHCHFFALFPAGKIHEPNKLLPIWVQGVDQYLAIKHTTCIPVLDDFICRLSDRLILERLCNICDLDHFYAYKWNLAAFAPVVCRLAKVWSNLWWRLAEMAALGFPIQARRFTSWVKFSKMCLGLSTPSLHLQIFVRSLIWDYVS